MCDDAVIGTGPGTREIAFDVPESLLHVTLDIEGETRGLGDGKTEVKGNNTRDASETDEKTPAVVDGCGGGGGLRNNRTLVGVDDDEGDESGS